MSVAYDQDDFFGKREPGDSKIAGLYDMGKTIGRGHFAVVKIAKHVFTEETVAVKVIDKMKLDELSRDHLFQEVVCMKLVQHPNIVRLYDVIDTTNKLYLVLELGDGGDLYDFIMRHESGLSEELAKRLFRQIVTAIAYCHRLHVVHRDLKPENVVYFEKLGIVKLTDFGFSNKFTPGATLNTSCGSLAYSAPEILLGGPYDAPKVDIWSLGVILYMLVCGCLPFQELNDNETLAKIMDCDYKLPTRLSPDCKQLISRLLIREPDQRPNLDDILSDVWLQSDLQDFPLERYSEPLISREQLTFEDHAEILNRMSEGGMASVESIQGFLDNDEYNHITATYFLLAERKLKRRHNETFADLAATQANLIQRIQAEQQLAQSNSTTDGTSQQQQQEVAASTHRRFSMILEDEEEEEPLSELGASRSRRQSRYMVHRISSLITGPLPSMLEEDDLANEEVQEEEEEYETVARLAWFRSDLPRIRAQSMSRCQTMDIGLSNGPANTLPTIRSESSFHINRVTMPNNSLRSSIIQQNPRLVRQNSSSHMLMNSVVLPMRPLFKVKSSPQLSSVVAYPLAGLVSVRDQSPGTNSVTVETNNNNEPGSADESGASPQLPRKRKLASKPRPGSTIIGYNSSGPGKLFERKRRSSISSPIGLDSSYAQKSLTQMMSLRHTPNSSANYHVFVPPMMISSSQGFGSRRFIDKRRSVPHNLAFPSSVLLPNSTLQTVAGSRSGSLSLRAQRSTGRSLSSSETQSDSEEGFKLPVVGRRGSSDMMLDYPDAAVPAKMLLQAPTAINNKRSDLMSVSAGGSIRIRVRATGPSCRPNIVEPNATASDWHSSAPSLLVDAAGGQLVVTDEPMPGAPARDVCAPIREEDDEGVMLATRPQGHSSRREESMMHYANIDRWRRSESAHQRTNSAYYTPFSRGSVGSATPWFVSMEEPETRSVVMANRGPLRFTRGHPNHNNPSMTNTSQVQISPNNMSMQSLLMTGGNSSSNYLKNSRHMMDILRGTFELQRRMSQLVETSSVKRPNSSTADEEDQQSCRDGEFSFAESAHSINQPVQPAVKTLSTVKSLTLLSLGKNRQVMRPMLVQQRGVLQPQSSLPMDKHKRNSVQSAYNETFEESNVSGFSRQTISSSTSNGRLKSDSMMMMMNGSNNKMAGLADSMLLSLESINNNNATAPGSFSLPLSKSHEPVVPVAESTVANSGHARANSTKSAAHATFSCLSLKRLSLRHKPTPERAVHSYSNSPPQARQQQPPGSDANALAIRGQHHKKLQCCSIS